MAHIEERTITLAASIKRKRPRTGTSLRTAARSPSEAEHPAKLGITRALRTAQVRPVSNALNGNLGVSFEPPRPVPASPSSAGGCRLSRERLRAWYSNDLESKVARAVAEGHVAAAQAANLHRLMDQLLDTDVSA